MTADLLNTLVGLGITYLAIFPRAAAGAGGNRLVLAAAVVTIMLALWARRTAVSPWQSSTAIAAGVILAIITIADQLAHVSDVLMFWTALWTGLVSATVSLWAALYRPTPSATAAE
jgi:hypothetical protein